jgi:hypothetical protein
MSALPSTIEGYMATDTDTSPARETGFTVALGHLYEALIMEFPQLDSASPEQHKRGYLMETPRDTMLETLPTTEGLSSGT